MAEKIGFAVDAGRFDAPVLPGAAIEHQEGVLTLADGTLLNAGTYHARANGLIAFTGSTSLFRNLSELIVTPTFQFTMDVPFDNVGSVRVERGTLWFNRAETNVVQLVGNTLTGGTWDAELAEIVFQGFELHTIDPGASIVGDGISFPTLRNLRTNHGRLTVAGILRLAHTELVRNTEGGQVHVRSGGRIIAPGGIQNGSDTSDGDRLEEARAIVATGSTAARALFQVGLVERFL